MKIFLDIDGVMVHANPQKQVELEVDGFYKFNSEAITTLNDILKEGDEIILSTSHRFRFKIVEWKELFKTRGIKCENFSRIGIPANILSRKEEILYWLSKQDIVTEDMIIIDDDKSLNDLSEEFKNKLILTNPFLGLNADITQPDR